MRNFWKKYFYILFLLLFGLILYLVKKGLFSEVDNYVYNEALKIRSLFMTRIMKAFSFLGSELFLLIFLVIFIWFIKTKRNIITFLVVFLVSEIANLTLKRTIARPRPSLLPLILENNYSFPSGHAMAATTFYGFLIYLINKSNLNKKQRIVFISLLVLVILAVSFSRVYLGVHYFSDILAGICLSLFLLNLIIRNVNFCK